MNDLTSESGLNSSVPAFVLMVQYLLNQQLNVTDNRCSKHEEEILKLHQERLEFERERERLETTFITIHKKYVAMERKLQAIEIKTKIKELQEQGRILNNNICNCTGIKRSSKLQSTETDSYHSTSLEKLQKIL
ncbi:hypothetical protein L9F63_022668 [Diploptera punctata]|uniref:Uncharacterized protein n=1 Tax=Diploptera punctata TaxID=6984 RepID=A0AAD7ZNG6_DIPPU|nr:hypothetical protein L9F63_022668 [Diploptera punctata]